MIYKLERIPNRRAIHLEFVTKVDCDELMEGIAPDTGVVCKVYSGSQWKDILTTTCATERVVSEKILNALKENNITGFKEIPINIKGFFDKKYYILGITRLEQEAKYNCENIVNIDGEKYVKGVSFDFDINVDIFTPKNQNVYYVNEKVKNLLSSITKDTGFIISSDDLTPIRFTNCQLPLENT